MGRRCAKTRFRAWHQPIRVWPLAAAILSFATIARAQPPIISLAGCGKIAKSGLYNLDAFTISATAGDCITVAASSVVLNLDGATITGSGSGVGIHVTSKASNSLIEGRAATISGFAVGIEIDGSKDAVENLTLSSNSDTGLLLKTATQAAITNITATDNTNDGVRLEKGSYNSLMGALDITDNGRYGIWLMSTNNNSIGGFFVEDNAIAGVYVGCATNGPAAGACKKGAAVSKGNSIFNGRVQASSMGSQTYGVIVDSGNDSNRITNISSPSPCEKYDLDDENPECAHNAWFANGLIFSSFPLDCIH